ncbi:MAG: hypothetical protein JXB34_04865 [Bacteroidales bacterium]|nr:hypothetical protein [Bacteroidales bacterium]
MPKPINALFAGLSIIDLQVFVPFYPASNTKTRTDKFEISTGGPATNAAITCSFLGAETTLISPVGKHYFSHSITESISQQDVQHIDPLKNIEAEPLIASIVTDESNGERTIFSYHPSNRTINYAPVTDIDIDNFHIVLSDGFYPEMAVELLKNTGKHKIPSVFDGGSWKTGTENILPYIDIAICSNDFHPPGLRSLDEIICYLQNYGIEKIAITRGGQSIVIAERGVFSEISVPQVACIDSLGAGDVFHGAFCYFYALGHSFRNALEKASEIASFSCMHRGTRNWMPHYLNQIKNKS